MNYSFMITTIQITVTLSFQATKIGIQIYMSYIFGWKKSAYFVLYVTNKSNDRETSRHFIVIISVLSTHVFLSVKRSTATFFDADVDYFVE